MIVYPKIQTVYKRDPETKYKTLLEGQYSLPEFEYLKDNEWEFTEKIDGTNILIMWDGKGNITFSGRTNKAQIQKPLLEYLEGKYPNFIEQFHTQFGETPVCLYGEGYGGKIQKMGKFYCDDPSFMLFDVRIGHWWLQREDIEKIGYYLLTDVVPIIGYGTLDTMVDECRRGFSSVLCNYEAEGIVAKPTCNLLCRNRSRVITKLKCSDFR